MNEDKNKAKACACMGIVCRSGARILCVLHCDGSVLVCVCDVILFASCKEEEEMNTASKRVFWIVVVAAAAIAHT